MDSLGGLAFFLLILCVGYMFVLHLGKDYHFPKGADINLEKTIHYATLGVFSQFILTMFWITPFFKNYFKILLDNVLKINDVNIQLFSIITNYFFVSIFFAALFGFCVKKIILSIKWIYPHGIGFLDSFLDHCFDFISNICVR